MFFAFIDQEVYFLYRNFQFNLATIFPFLSAFHDALGDTIALSVSTPKHLQTLGLIQRPVDDTAHDINFLFTLAMDKVHPLLSIVVAHSSVNSIAHTKCCCCFFLFVCKQVVFLPFALAMDVWRWDVFNKNVNADHYNCHWWLLRFNSLHWLLSNWSEHESRAIVLPVNSFIYLWHAMVHLSNFIQFYFIGLESDMEESNHLFCVRKWTLIQALNSIFQLIFHTFGEFFLWHFTFLGWEQKHVCIKCIDMSFKINV